MAIGHTLIGDGPEHVIVCHGWFGDHGAFEPVMSSLDTHAFTYAFMDYRGYGKSTDLSGEFTMAEIADDALALADHLGWDRFHLIGHSMGGMAVQRILADAPGRVKTIVAITPVPASGVAFDEEGWALFSGAIDSDEKRAAIIDFTTGNRLSQSWVRHMVANSRRTTTVDAFAGYLEAWAKSDFSDEIKGKETPVLVIVGEHDPALNEELMKDTFLAWYPDSRLEMMANAGHYPMIETPVALATLMQTFMEAHG